MENILKYIWNIESLKITVISCTFMKEGILWLFLCFYMFEVILEVIFI